MTASVPAPLAQKIANIAASFTAIQYDSLDPQVALIETIARQHGLTLCPSTAITPRTIRGCAEPPAAAGRAEPAGVAEQREALAAALLSADINAVARVGKVTADALLHHLHRKGWTLTRTADAAPSAATPPQ